MNTLITIEPHGRILAEDVRWARSLRARVVGLIGSPELRSEEALVITPGYQVHTFGMRFPIDVIFCSREWMVLHVVPSMKPRRVSKLVRGSRYVIEMRAGSAAAGVEVGTRLSVRDT